MLLPEKVLAQAVATFSIESDRDPEGFARLLWPTRAFQQWPGGPIFCLAQLLTERLRPAASLSIPAANLHDHSKIAAWLPNTRPPAVENLLNRLACAGFLDNATPGLWRLTLPPRPPRP
jgi:hypothetical protein